MDAIPAPHELSALVDRAIVRANEKDPLLEAVS